MRTKQIQGGTLCLSLLALAAPVFLMLQANAAPALPTTDAPVSKPTSPWPDIGASAGADYKGDGLSVGRTESGARLRCVWQRLEGEATSEGLWLRSTVTDAVSERFRVVASSVGRDASLTSGRQFEPPHLGSCKFETLPASGEVSVDGQTVRFTRAGLVEEYSVSMDGVRQDFLVMAPPVGAGPLEVQLAVTGARVEQIPQGAQLVLENSGRKIVYSRLLVTDATGKELPARMEFVAALPTTLSVVVEDTHAVYPIRIDPIFSDANWVGMGGFPGADARVWAAVVDASGNLYIGGNFIAVGDIVVNYIAKWNGNSWSALSSGMGGGVTALAVSGSDLYAAGVFSSAGGSPANRIAKWNGSSWSPLGSGIGGDGQFAPIVYALTASGSNLYAGGTFTTAGGNSATNIAKWNGISWSALGSGMGGALFPTENYVRALAVSGSDLYAGGAFTKAGGISANRVAKWNGSSWSALGSGISGGQFVMVYALAASGSNLYVGGEFTTAGGNPAASIARWNGSTWSAVGSGLGGQVNVLAVFGSDLYAGGAGPDFGIAKWNGSGWSLPTAAAIAAGGVYALALSGSYLYAGGSFTTAGGTNANYIARWNGNSWSPLGSGMGGGGSISVRALAVSGSDVYAGGDFTTVGSISANGIARWNGSSWTPLGSGINSTVYALAVAGSDLYVGGYFTAAGGQPATNIARWNGSGWSPLGSGMNGIVWALAVSGSDVYAGGSFTRAGGNPATNIAKWNGSSWSALGSGAVNGTVYALAVSGSNLYAGGQFTIATVAINIAQWNGSSWSRMVQGMNDTVYALVVSGSNLYAGGAFRTTVIHPDNPDGVARWNGSRWSALGSGIIGTVRALAVSGGDLYAGGDFTTAGGSPANRVARWNGTNWSALGSGINDTVRALGVSGSDLYAGGDFSTAGGKVSAYVARAYLERPALSIVRSGGDVALSWPTFYETFVLQQNPDAANPNTWSNASHFLTTNGAMKRATAPNTPANRFFRLSGN